jgi:type III restriction enzyme
MATGTGKTTVMGMLAAWSILNKVVNRADARFSDLVLAVCPNVTIRDRLQELDVERGEASLYRTRDLVPPAMMPRLAQGRVVVTNWHVFEPRTQGVGDVSAGVLKVGQRVTRTERVYIGDKNTTARGDRYLTEAEYIRLVASAELEELEPPADRDGRTWALVRWTRYVESDTSIVQRVLGRSRGKQNILVTTRRTTPTAFIARASTPRTRRSATKRSKTNTYAKRRSGSKVSTASTSFAASTGVSIFRRRPFSSAPPAARRGGRSHGR